MVTAPDLDHADALPALAVVSPVAHRSLPEAVLDELRRIIVNGHLAPGSRLVETELAAGLGVSRATVRQALHRLEVEGLVEMRPRRGAVVAHMSSEVAFEVCQVRGLLEGFAARTACATLSTGQLEEMRRLAREMGAAIEDGDVLLMANLDTQFHTVICGAHPNRRLLDLWSTLDAQNAALISSRLSVHRYDAQTVVDLHLTLCDVLERGDPDAAEAAVREHYVGAEWNSEGVPEDEC